MITEANRWGAQCRKKVKSKDFLQSVVGSNKCQKKQKPFFFNSSKIEWKTLSNSALVSKMGQKEKI